MRQHSRCIDTLNLVSSITDSNARSAELEAKYNKYEQCIEESNKYHYHKLKASYNEKRLTYHIENI